MTPDPARGRFLTLAMLRIAGALAIMVGIVIASDRVAGVPAPVGWLLVIAGFATIGLLTRRLARRWRTPPGADRP